MKTIILAAFATMSLVVGSSQRLSAATLDTQSAVHHSGPSENMDFEPSGSEVEGGWG